MRKAFLKVSHDISPNHTKYSLGQPVYQSLIKTQFL